MSLSLADQTPPDVLKLLAHEVRWQLLAALSRSDYCVQELVNRLHKPMNLISYHLRLLRTAAIVHERRSSADARDVYYSLDLEHFHHQFKAAVEGLHPALGDPQPASAPTTVDVTQPRARVLFLCTHNSARSQLAEALLRHLAGGRAEAFSAGTEPGRVHPQALAVLDRQGVAAEGLYSKSVTQFVGQHFDYVITVCDRAKESCPIFPGDPERIHWSFPDPSAVAPEEQPLAFTQTFVGLEKRLKLLLTLIDREKGDA
jgi:ArsR family transcriptional regulator, arsenate/arsenite/antimonite-responsive transcriptional repressor / arsenate reductase (thioredoxin)